MSNSAQAGVIVSSHDLAQLSTVIFDTFKVVSTIP